MKKNLLILFTIFFTAGLFAQPVITQNPQSMTLCFSICEPIQVTAVGNALTYHWQRMDSSGWVNLSSSADSSYLFCADTTVDTTMVRCVVEDDMGLMDTSSIAMIRTDSCLAPVADFEFLFWGDSVCFENKSKNATTVLWNFGNGGQSTEFSPCYDYMAYEAFKARLYVYNDYGVDVIEKDIDLTSIEELVMKLDIYPNPTSGQIFISSDEIIIGIQVFGLEGNMVGDFTMRQLSSEVDLSSLAKGIYLLQLQTEKTTIIKKIILQ
jgi:hypothetical protein